MNEQTKEEKQKADELFKLILKKTGLKYTDFLFLVKHNYVASNIDILSQEEKDMYLIDMPNAR